MIERMNKQRQSNKCRNEQTDIQNKNKRINTQTNKQTRKQTN